MGGGGDFAKLPGAVGGGEDELSDAEDFAGAAESGLIGGFFHQGGADNQGHSINGLGDIPRGTAIAAWPFFLL